MAVMTVHQCISIEIDEDDLPHGVDLPAAYNSVKPLLEHDESALLRGIKVDRHPPSSHEAGG